MKDTIITVTALISAITSFCALYMSLRNTNQLLHNSSGWRSKLFDAASKREIEMEEINLLRTSLRYQKIQNTKEGTFNWFSNESIEFCDRLISKDIKKDTRFSLSFEEQEVTRLIIRCLLRNDQKFSEKYFVSKKFSNHFVKQPLIIETTKTIRDYGFFKISESSKGDNDRTNVENLPEKSKVGFVVDTILYLISVIIIYLYCVSTSSPYIQNFLRLKKWETSSIVMLITIGGIFVIIPIVINHRLKKWNKELKVLKKIYDWVDFILSTFFYSLLSLVILALALPNTSSTDASTIRTLKINKVHNKDIVEKYRIYVKDAKKDANVERIDKILNEVGKDEKNEDKKNEEIINALENNGVPDAKWIKRIQKLSQFILFILTPSKIWFSIQKFFNDKNLNKKKVGN